MPVEELVKAVIITTMPIFAVAIALYTIRIIKGPTVPDMALAVDCLSYDVCFFMALLAIYFEAPFLIVCAICLALWTYIFSVYIAKYLERKELGE
ncbi:MAG: monovalent cation/H+ antiporter complex subunit F [Candidatus Nezhaarchaeota archaeon]|nr:monovalent cation/H+ antiporter complex subunit F [Candidatus Nezhaarchaeota archaeon]MCX8142318.1 monovalent cation/H+ antiporter complex subunit F [Candidatus Nezhaarchaeota archaeon]MDW8050709.1 monovalent cation/H+ antiporter complex subunit F [Nitrososphaerota archaeon]